MNRKRAITRRDALRIIGASATAIGLGSVFSEHAQAQEASQETIDALTKKLGAKGFHFPEKFETKNEGNGLLYPSVMMPERGWTVEPICVSAVYDFSSPSKLSKVQVAFPMPRNVGEQRNLGSKMEVYVDGKLVEFPQGVVYTMPFTNPFLAAVLQGAELQGSHTVGIKFITYMMTAVEPLDPAKNSMAFSSAVHSHLSSTKEFPYEPTHMLNMYRKDVAGTNL